MLQSPCLNSWPWISPPYICPPHAKYYLSKSKVIFLTRKSNCSAYLQQLFMTRPHSTSLGWFSSVSFFYIFAGSNLEIWWECLTFLQAYHASSWILCKEHVFLLSFKCPDLISLPGKPLSLNIQLSNILKFTLSSNLSSQPELISPCQSKPGVHKFSYSIFHSIRLELMSLDLL